MRVASGRVIDGRVETFEVDAETERMLLESIAQCERGETIPFETVIEGLRRRE
jgi:hypothetical protein